MGGVLVGEKVEYSIKYFLVGIGGESEKSCRTPFVVPSYPWIVGGMFGD